MNGIEALQEALNGEKIRRQSWEENTYLVFNGSILETHGCNKCSLLVSFAWAPDALYLSKDQLEKNDWEIYKEKPKLIRNQVIDDIISDIEVSIYRDDYNNKHVKKEVETWEIFIRYLKGFKKEMYE